MLALCENLLDALSERFNPPAKVYRPLEQAIETINDAKTLRSLFTMVLQAETIEEFQQAVAQATQRNA
jgi:hypothetical protein